MAEKEYIPIEIDIDYKKATNAQDAFIKDMGRLKSSILDIREENKKLNKEYNDTAKDASLSTTEQIEKRKLLTQQIAKNEETLKKLSKEQRDARTAYTAVDKGVDAYERMSAELTTLRKKIRGIQADGGIVSKADLERADELDGKLKGIDSGLGQFLRNVGNYSSAFDGILGKVGGGGGIGDLLAGFKGAVNPITAVGTALVALTGYVAGVTLEYEKLQNTVTKATGLQGEQAREVTANIKAISDTFNQDFNEVTIATNAFAKQLGIDFDEALGLVEKGFLNGADAQGDFLDTLKEYPAFIKQANLSAEDFIELQIRAQREGIFSDKLIDAIKESDLSLKEFTKTQRDALLPLGQQFADELEKGIASGTITTVDALTMIQKRAKEAGLNLRDTATITADIFKGAGEDAGGAAKILEIVNETLAGSLDDLTISSDAYYSRQLLILESNKRLSTAQSELASSFAGLGGSFAGLGNNIKAFFVEQLNSAISRLETLSFYISGFKSLLKGEGFDKGFVAAVKRSTEAVIEQKESTEELTEEQKKSIIQTRLQAEQQQKASEARLAKIREIKAEIADLKDTLGQVQDEYRFDIIADINKLQTQLAGLGVEIGERIGAGLVAPIKTLNLLPAVIESETSVRKAKEESERQFLEESNERVKENLDEQERIRKQKEKQIQSDLIQIQIESLNLIGTIANGIGQIAQTRDENEKTRLEEKYNREIELATGNADKQAELQKELEKEKRKIDQAAFERSKRLQILEATINFQKGLTNILSLAGTDVFTTPILKGVQIAALVAQYVSSIAAISSAKFAKGTVLQGDSHERGGVKLYSKTGSYYGEAEGGEPILTKGTSRNPKTLGILSYINQKYGGARLGGASIPDDIKQVIDSFMGTGTASGFNIPSPPMRIYARGGVVQAQQNVQDVGLTKEEIGQAVAEAVKGITIVTEVRDIIDSTEKYNTVINNSKVA